MLAHTILRSGARAGCPAARPALVLMARTSRLTIFPKYARSESTITPPTPPKTKEKAVKFRDETFQWNPPVVIYDQVKLKTLQPSPDSYLIDVREPDEVIQGSIPSSVNLPLSVLSGSLNLTPKEFNAKFGFEKPKREQEIVFYCRSGARSTTACEVAKRNGYTNLHNYKGSWLEWVQKEGISTPGS